MHSKRIHRVVLSNIELLVILKANYRTGEPESYFISNQNNKLKLI